MKSALHQSWTMAAWCVLATMFLFVRIAFALPQETTFFLRPHCEEDVCPEFELSDDGLTQLTQELTKGDVLDLDLLVVNPNEESLSLVRALLQYDATVLDGMSVDISDAWVATPGRADFSIFSGELILEMEPAESEFSAPVGEIARIRFEVIDDTAQAGTPILFGQESDEHTAILSGPEGQITNILEVDPGILTVLFDTVAEEVEPQEQEAETTEAEAAQVPSQETRTAFVLLQPQNVRVGTEGGSVFLVWDALQSNVLSLYNVYWSSTSGRYIHRRTITKDEPSLTIRGVFTVGETYYFAIRGVNDKGEETAFSREVAITVGDPASSTAPFTYADGSTARPDTSAPDHPLTPGQPGGSTSIPGETGTSTVLIVLLLLSGIVGILFAWRRQSRPIAVSHFHNEE